MKKNNKRKAFTIVELVIVIAVIAILATVLVPTFGDVISNAKDSKLLQEVKNEYTQYLIDHAADEADHSNMLCYMDDGRIVALKDGSPIKDAFDSESEAVAALMGSADGYTVTGTLSGKFYSVVSSDAVKESKWKGATAVFVGDSITAVSEHTSKFYYQHLQEMLGLDNVEKKAQGGSCISEKSDYGKVNTPLINRYQNIPDADLIVIFMGTNDYGHETPLGQITDTSDTSFYGALNVIIPGIQAAHPDSQLVVITPLHRYGFGTSKITGKAFTNDSNPNGRGYCLEDYVDALKAIGQKYSVPVIDLFNEFPLDPEREEVRDVYMPDGLHPNAEGHKLMARIIAANLELISRKDNDGSAEEPQSGSVILGNRFAEGFEDRTDRASSTKNLYLKAGTIVTIKDNANYDWALAKTADETSSAKSGNYYPENKYTTLGYCVIQEDGWYGFTFTKGDDAAFDFSGTDSDELLDYFVISETVEMQYGNRVIAGDNTSTRLSSAINVYLPANTTIKFDSTNATHWAIAKVATAGTKPSTENYMLFGTASAWLTLETATISEEGYYCLIVTNNKDNTANLPGFDLGNASTDDLFDFFEISGY